ncbi:MAG: class I SAM-dependent methyltransferase [Burkholderiales bacterium]
MSARRNLLRSLLCENPFQPATSWWRAVELAVVIEHGLPSGTGLDLGCGDGKLMRILLEASRVSPSLVGVDIDPLETRDAVESGVYQRVHTGPADRIPEPDAAFDFVYSNSVLEHIDDIEPVIAEVGRLLRPGGTFLFTVPGAGFHECLAGPLLPWSDRGDYLERIDRRCAHRRYWGEAQWRACLGRHGLEPVRTVEYLTAPETQRWETLSRFTAGILYAVFGERRQPIEIQRALRLRRSGLRLPVWAAGALAATISAGVGVDHKQQFGCLLVDARKRP